MLTRLHRLVAFYAARATYRRMGARHWFTGLCLNSNDNGIA